MPVDMGQLLVRWCRPGWRCRIRVHAQSVDIALPGAKEPLLGGTWKPAGRIGRWFAAPVDFRRQLSSYAVSVAIAVTAVLVVGRKVRLA